MYTYSSPLNEIKGIGDKRAQSFADLGVNNLYDLLHFYPVRYNDFSVLTQISKLKDGETACFKGRVSSAFEANYIRTKMTLYKGTVSDETGEMTVTFFNTPYIAKSLSVGQEYLFYGKAAIKGRTVFMSSPLVLSPDEERLIRPVYHQTALLKSNTVAKFVSSALEINESIVSDDPIPTYIRHEYKLCTEQYALININFPKNHQTLEIAKRRLIFEELLVLQTAMLKMRKSNRGQSENVIKKDYTYDFIKKLPFSLTNAQFRCIKQCADDMKSGRVMNRLLQGDVGSGKTAVACALIYSAVNNGLQCAFMAPTEILANQHYQTLKSFFGDEVEIALLTGSVGQKTKRQLKDEIKNGKIKIAVGTHALLTSDVEFERLGLVITDEQHRFGVFQRSALSSKGKNPHVLVMSATPIPRTLSLIIYGELDISILDEKPKGRQEIATYVVDSSYKERIYNFLKKYLDSGSQGYIVCPAVEEGETGMASAVKYAEEFSKKQFSSYSVGLLHGKMKPKEKNKVMENFLGGKIQLLVSTTVIEVGIDVPNAAVMVIENADRFGLSQLHQLRGRVGRGSVKSSCVLISDTKSDETKKRLNVMKKTNDGFVIANEDLKLRGPGDFFGSRQHGLPMLKIANLVEDMVTLEEARTAAQTVLKDDPTLEKGENLGLSQAIDRLFEKEIAIN